MEGIRKMLQFACYASAARAGLSEDQADMCELRTVCKGCPFANALADEVAAGGCTCSVCGDEVAIAVDNGKPVCLPCMLGE